MWNIKNKLTEADNRLVLASGEGGGERGRLYGGQVETRLLVVGEMQMSHYNAAHLKRM